MARLTGFFHDRRGLAAADYAFAVALLFATGRIAQHYADLVGPPLRHLLG